MQQGHIRPQKVNYVFLVPCLAFFLLISCATTRLRLSKKLLILFSFTACMLCKQSVLTCMLRHCYSQYQVLQCDFPFLQCEVKCTQSKSRSPAQFWEVGMIKTKFTLHGINEKKPTKATVHKESKGGQSFTTMLQAFNVGH